MLTQSEIFKPFLTLTPIYEMIRKFVQCHPGQLRVLLLADNPLSHLILQQFLNMRAQNNTSALYMTVVCFK